MWLEHKIAPQMENKYQIEADDKLTPSLNLKTHTGKWIRKYYVSIMPTQKKKESQNKKKREEKKKIKRKIKLLM